MDARIAKARAALGTDVPARPPLPARRGDPFADFTGDSYKLSKIAAETEREVHALLRRALYGGDGGRAGRKPWQQVILPDLNAGCSMADMAEIGQVEDCWDSLEAGWVQMTGLGGSRRRLDSADLHELGCSIKAFCGERGGLVCTSSNARAALSGRLRAARRFCFCPTSISAATPPSRWGFR
jgi:quinolinate synthase